MLHYNVKWGVYMKKQPEVTTITKQNLQDAFWTLYCQKRIEKITIKEITALAGYNRSTFYEYFIDVYDVLEQIENELLPNLVRMPLSEMPRNDALDNSAFGSLFKFFEENSKYITVLLGEHGDPSFLSKIKKTVSPIIKQALIEKGAKDNFQLDAWIEYNLSAMVGIFNLWFTTEDKPPLDELIKFMQTIKSKGEAEIISKLINPE